jgi:hypothetical protein
VKQALYTKQLLRREMSHINLATFPKLTHLRRLSLLECLRYVSARLFSKSRLKPIRDVLFHHVQHYKDLNLIALRRPSIRIRFASRDAAVRLLAQTPRSGSSSRQGTFLVFVFIPAMAIFKLPHASILLDLLARQGRGKPCPRVEYQIAGCG